MVFFLLVPKPSSAQVWEEVLGGIAAYELWIAAGATGAGVVYYVHKTQSQTTTDDAHWLMGTEDPTPEDPNRPDWNPFKPGPVDYEWIAITLASAASNPDVQDWVQNLLDKGYDVYRNGNQVRAIVSTEKNSLLIGENNVWTSVTIPATGDPIIKTITDHQQVINTIHQALVNSPAWGRGLQNVAKVNNRVVDAIKKGVDPSIKDIVTLVNFTTGNNFGDFKTECAQVIADKILEKFCALKSDQDLMEQVISNLIGLKNSVLHISAVVRLCRNGNQVACELLRKIVLLSDYLTLIPSLTEDYSEIIRGNATSALTIFLRHLDCTTFGQVFDLGEQYFRTNGISPTFMTQLKWLLLRHGFDLKEWMLGPESLGLSPINWQVNLLEDEGYISDGLRSPLRRIAQDLDGLFAAGRNAVPEEFRDDAEDLLKDWNYNVRDWNTR